MNKKILVTLLSVLTAMVPISTSYASFFHPTPSASPTATDASTGTAVTATNTYVAGSSIPVGPGPSGHYTVQKQPPAGSCHYRYTADKQPLPDPNCTPGATNPLVTQANIGSTICVKGYTSTIRPPANITGREKKANALSYGYTGSLKTFEYDHLLSLELAGDPNDARNLWVEPASPGHKGSGVNNPKDGVENKLHSAICSGRVTLAQAEEAITTDWTTALSKLGLK